MKRAIVMATLLMMACGDRDYAETMSGLSARSLKQISTLCWMQGHTALSECPDVRAKRLEYIRYCTKAAPWWKQVNCEGLADSIELMGKEEAR